MAGLTADRVARRSGVAKTTIFRHFSSVHDLVVAALDDMVNPVATPDTGSLRGDLIELFGSRLPLSGDPRFRRMVLGLLSASATSNDPELARVNETMQRLRAEPIRDVLSLAIARGEARADIDLTDAIDLIEGPLFTRAMLRGERLTPTDLETLIDLTISGLARRP